MVIEHAHAYTNVLSCCVLSLAMATVGQPHAPIPVGVLALAVATVGKPHAPNPVGTMQGVSFVL
jgi:hypothetical protein